MTINNTQHDIALPEIIRATARKEALWQSGMTILAAVSGGPDSVALLDALASLAESEKVHLAIAHVNHGLREAAGTEAEFVANLAKDYDMPFLLRHADVRGRMRETGESLEEAARHARYTALDEMAHEARADVIATGHNADDQSETVLMRILRGTGLAGLAGIPYRRGRIIRPLLDVQRAEIMAYVGERGLRFVSDESNLSADFTRNRVRLELLPLLESRFSPEIRANLFRLAEQARQDEAALRAWSERAFCDNMTELPDGIALPHLPNIPTAIQRRVWRMAIAEIRGELNNIDQAHIEAIEGLSPLQETHLPGVAVRHEYGRLVFLPLGHDSCAESVETPLLVPGELNFAPMHCTLSSDYCEVKSAIRGGDVATMDADAISLPLYVRTWQPSDRFQPFGAPGSRAVQDILVDARVPRRYRKKIPLVFDQRGIVWLAGFRIADRVKMHAETKSSISLTIEWEFNPWTLNRSNDAR